MRVILLVRQAWSDVLPSAPCLLISLIISNYFINEQPCNLSPSSLHCAFWQQSPLLCLPSKMSCKRERLRTSPSFSQWDSPQTECQHLYDQSHPQHQTHQCSNWRTCPWSAYFSVFSPSVSSCQSFTHGIWSFTLTSTYWRWVTQHFLSFALHCVLLMSIDWCGQLCVAHQSQLLSICNILWESIIT